MGPESHTLLELLERLAPGTALRIAVERIIQQGHGALVLLGSNELVDSISSGGFRLVGAGFTAARLAELAKMDGGIVLDNEWERILAANVHFLPSSSIRTEETGARHRTAERIAAQTGIPVLAVSEDRRVATIYHAATKVELVGPTAAIAKVNQSLQSLDRFRRRLDEAQNRLTALEVSDLSTYRSAVNVVQRAELVRRIGQAIERDTIALGDEGSLARLQLTDLVKGVEPLRDTTLRDYLGLRKERAVREAIDQLEELATPDLDDPIKVAKVVGFGELDEPARPHGFRVLLGSGRLPEPVREELARRFRGVPEMVAAQESALVTVEGIGPSRAAQLRRYFDRLRQLAEEWGTDST